MLIKFQSLKVVSFREHPIPDYLQVEPGKFDLTTCGLDIPGSFVINNQFSMKHYCYALFFKACSIEFAETEEFIDYQISQLKNPVHWLKCFENLIIENFSFYSCPKDLYILNNLRDILHDKKNELKSPAKLIRSDWSDFEMPMNRQNHWVRFESQLVKYDLSKFATIDEKRAYLIELEADYLQSGKIFMSKNPVPLDEFIKIELNRLDRIEVLNINNNSKKTVSNRHSNNGKGKINGNVNVLADALYQMNNKIMADGLPYLEASIAVISSIIINNFIDKDGQPISMSTVKTYLSPGKADKRPSLDKRIKLLVDD